jgi:D-alanine--poly(phosphoribitol) ligase subunit 2
MLDTQNVETKISKLLAGKVHVEAPSSATDLMEAGILDSLALIELIVGLEKEFGVQIPFEQVEIDDFRSVAAISRYVTRLVRRQ